MIVSKEMSTIVNGDILSIDKIIFNVESKQDGVLLYLKGITPEGIETDLIDCITTNTNATIYKADIPVVPVVSIHYEIDHEEYLLNLNSVIIITGNAFPIVMV